MKRIVVRRRQFLRGAGGFTLGLPFLPSLVPNAAHAQVTFARPSRFLAITNMHGGVLESAFYPADATLTETKDLYTGHVIRRGNLTGRAEGTDTVISSVLRAPSGRLTPKLVSKMSVLRGLDIPFYIAHNTGGMLGNYARNDGNGGDGQAIQSKTMPTIDQVMAWSPSFYKSLDGIRERSMVTDLIHNRISWNWASPSSRTGAIQGIRTAQDPGSLFQRVFVPRTDVATPMARKPIADRVLENYKSLMQSNRRLSAGDKQRLNDHVEMLTEVQRRANATGSGPTASCKDQKAPAGGGGSVGSTQAFIDVFAAAFACGTSRVAVIGTDESDFVSFSGSWHQETAHVWENAAAQQRLQEANRRVFADVFVRAIAALDVEEQPGQTILDNTLVIWSKECGEETHDSRSIPVVIAGAAGGSLTTGHYADYRNPTKRVGRGPSGLLYSQFLATCLQAVGVPRSEWQTIPNNGAAGYGVPQVTGGYLAYVAGVRENASDFLPFLKAT